MKSERWMRGKERMIEELRILGNKSGCHQMPERSFFFHGKQFPICARCTGVVAGELAAIVSFLVGLQIRLVSCFVLLGIMGTDWGLQYAKIKPSTNRRRLITGVLGGFGLFHLYRNCIVRISKLLPGRKTKDTF